MMLRQLGVTALDTVAAGGVLWVLLPPGAISYSPSCRSSRWRWSLGILSHVPAGLGVFEAVLLGGARRHSAAGGDPRGLRALPADLPGRARSALAAAGLTVAEARRFTARGPAAAALRALTGLAPQVLATLALVLGAMLVFSGVTPARRDRPRLARELPAAAR